MDTYLTSGYYLALNLSILHDRRFPAQLRYHNRLSSLEADVTYAVVSDVVCNFIVGHVWLISIRDVWRYLNLTSEFDIWLWYLLWYLTLMSNFDISLWYLLISDFDICWFKPNRQDTQKTTKERRRPFRRRNIKRRKRRRKRDERWDDETTYLTIASRNDHCSLSIYPNLYTVLAVESKQVKRVSESASQVIALQRMYTRETNSAVNE